MKAISFCNFVLHKEYLFILMVFRCSHLGHFSSLLNTARVHSDGINREDDGNLKLYFHVTVDKFYFWRIPLAPLNTL